jgi:hypothetical protein
MSEATFQTIINGLISAAFGIPLFVLALYQSFFKSYFTEKGKNVATHEDIAEITRQVEAVKTEFASKTEHLRTDLQYFNQIRFSVKTEEKNALVDCYEKYQYWLNLLLSIYLSDVNDLTKSTEKKGQIDEAYFRCLLAETKMNLYMVDDKEFLKLFISLKIATLKYQNYIHTELITNEHLISDRELAINSVEAGNYKKMSEIRAEFREKAMQQTIAFNEEKLKHYSPIAKDVGTFQELTLARIINIESLTKRPNPAE